MLTNSPSSQLTTTFSGLCPVWEASHTAIKNSNALYLAMLFYFQIISNLFVNTKEIGNNKILCSYLVK
jgi:hypothetical protein